MEKNNENMKVISMLYLNKEFQKAMDKNIDEALKNEGLNPEKDFVNNLKQLQRTKKFTDINSGSINELNEAFDHEVSLESRW